MIILWLEPSYTTKIIKAIMLFILILKKIDLQ